MAGISSAGIGSNLDVNGIVSQLMAIEKQPLTRLAQKEASAQARLSAYGLIKGALSSFQTSMAGLASNSKYTSISASTSDATVGSASASSVATPGTYSLEVTKIAKEQKLRSDVLSTTSVNETLGTGTLTIQLGTYSGGVFTANADKAAATITIDSSNQSLAGVRDAINAANAGVRANIVNDGSGFRLSLTSTSTGTANSLKVTVADDGDGNSTNASGLSRIAFDPAAAAGSGKNLTESQAAQDAQLTVDGIAVTKSSNTLTDVIQGVTLNLLKETTVGTPLTVTVSRSNSAVTTAAQDFVKAYNELAKTIGDLTKYTPKTETSAAQAGVLQGEATPRSIMYQLRNALGQSVATLDGKRITLSDLGIAFQKDGTLALDSSKLNKQVEANPDIIAGFFASAGRATDSGIRFISAGSSTAVGGYSVSLTQMASRGTLVASGAANTVITDTNKTLNVMIDGASATVTLGTGTYTAASLAAEVQSRINGTSAFKQSGLGVTVSADVSGVLTLTSNSYGSTSKLAVSGAGASDLLGGSGSATDGVDIAGTIGGLTATGSGQTLTAENGIKLSVLSGSTGARGDVYYTRGFASLMDTLASALADSKTGAVSGATGGIDAQLKDIAKQREAMNRRLEQTELRLRAQFTALDTLMGKMSSTSSYLSQQLTALSSLNQ